MCSSHIELYELNNRYDIMTDVFLTLVMAANKKHVHFLSSICEVAI